MSPRRLPRVEAPAPTEELRELALARMVERGLADSENGRTLSSEEMDERI